MIEEPLITTVILMSRRPKLLRRAGFRQSTVSSTLRITAFTFIISRLIRRSGRGDVSSSRSRWAFAYGRAAAAAELLIRVWNPLVADELLLVARK